MSASVVGPLAAATPDRYLALTAGLALVVGAILLAAGIVRLGFIADFLAKSVVTGFIFGLAITIIIGQLPKLLGVPGGGDGTIEQVQVLVDNLPDTNPWTLAVGVGALALILVLRAISRKIPGPLVALVLGIIAVKAFDLEVHDVSVVGEMPDGDPDPRAAEPRRSSTFRSSPRALAGIVFLAVGESLGPGGPSRRGTSTRSTPTRSSSRSARRTSRRGCSAASPWMPASRSRPLPSRRGPAPSSPRSSRRRSSSRRPCCSRRCSEPAQHGPRRDRHRGGPGPHGRGELRRYAATPADGLHPGDGRPRGGGDHDRPGRPRGRCAPLADAGPLPGEPAVRGQGRQASGEQATFVDLRAPPEGRGDPGLLMLRIDAPLYFFNVNVAHSAILEAVTASDPPPSAGPARHRCDGRLRRDHADIVRQLIGELQTAVDRGSSWPR